MFGYTYLPGTHLLQTLTKPNNMSLTLSYEDKRDLLTGMSYKRGNTGVASRTYTYDAAGRPITRNTSLPFSHIAAPRFEYDAMGNVSKKTLSLADVPDETNSPTEVYAYGAEFPEDGILEGGVMSHTVFRTDKRYDNPRVLLETACARARGKEVKRDKLRTERMGARAFSITSCGFSRMRREAV